MNGDVELLDQDIERRKSTCMDVISVFPSQRKNSNAVLLLKPLIMPMQLDVIFVRFLTTTSKMIRCAPGIVLLRLHLIVVNEHSKIFRYGLTSWTKMKRAAATILKFIKRILKSRYREENLQNKGLTQYTELYYISEGEHSNAKYLELAENVLIRDHYRTMTEKQLHCYKHLNLKLRNHIPRCRGRLENSNLGFETTHLVLLPNHIMTRLIIRDTHQKIGHQGVNAALSEIQRYLRVPQGRVRILRPFVHVGIDYTGPFTVNVSETLHKKRRIFLITCMSTRAIHLNIVQGLTTVELIRALRRFISHRGSPKTITSDNATTFELGSAIVETLSEITEPVDDINNGLVNRGIQRNLITPLSPWKIKSCLRENVNRKFTSDDGSLTVATEYEAIVNSRPLTYVSSDIKDAMPIRSVAFLHPHANITPWRFEPDYDPEYSGTSIDVEKFSEETKDSLAQFWNMWSQKDTSSRFQWNLGITVALHPGADNVLRTVSLRKSYKITTKRSVNQLIPLEISVSDEFVQ
ncbi:unnamed protein product [Haemonchus placei]|uniref:Integrase catalytic domain-containing protein n=1 Tax=Haemonchus placei TaxID=6290 RepID=A0A0N4W2E3_HAEPC|nr:unnamed protein product [Haemonchus placei]